MPDSNLTVPHGQVTFDAEGNDVSNSIYFSRVIHWPGGISGVTIGRGYDFGHRGSADLIASEFAKSNIDLTPFKGAIGLQGSSASDWVKANKASTPTITHQQQIDLFAFTYESIKKDVIRLATKADVERAYGVTNFDTLNSAILEIVVDLRYRGDYTPTSRKRVQPCMVNNDLAAFRTLMADRDFWSNVPPDRFNRRNDFLENAGSTSTGASSSETTSATVPADTRSPTDDGRTSAAEQPAPAPVSNPTTHVVESGESLSKLSQRFGVSIDALKAANASKLKRWGNIEGFNAGETITIPS